MEKSIALPQALPEIMSNTSKQENPGLRLEGNLSAQERIRALQEKIKQTSYPSPPHYQPGVGVLLRKISNVTSLEFLRNAFVTRDQKAWDTLPPGRRKQLHSTGVTVGFEMKPVSGSEKTNPYSGVLGAVASEGILRLSNAKGPVTEKQPHVQPGIAIKWVIDRSPSVNLAIMPSLIPQQRRTDLDAEGKKEFFRFPFSNHPSIPLVDEFPYISGPFDEAQLSFANPLFERPNRLPLEHLSEVNPKGERISEKDARAPFEFFFKPTEELTIALQKVREKADSSKKELYLNDIRHWLTALGKQLVGKRLFEVYQRSTISDAKTVYTHDIFATGEFVSSSFGDTQLWFPHQLPGKSVSQCPVQNGLAKLKSTRLRWLGAAFNLRSRAIAPEKRAPEPILEKNQ